MDRRYTIAMGCSESREDKKISSISVYSLKTPLPLHIYQYSTTSSHSTPKSSPTNQLPKSPTNQSPTPKSPTSKSYDNPKTHLSRLNTIAHFKFPMFREFQPNVQQEILLHIDKELRKQ
jgi:hypothetical protein